MNIRGGGSFDLRRLFKKTKPPVFTWRCTVHGDVSMRVSVFGSKPVCSKCVADFIDNNFQALVAVPKDNK